jgi:endonuclease G
LEKDVRKWAKTNGRVFIVTGPVLEKGLNKIGNEEVSVPNYFYKIILDIDEPEIKEIAFIIPNKAITTGLWDYTCTTADVEKRTGINFFPSLPDSIEHRLENSLDIQPWKNTEVKKRVKK